MQSAQLGLEPDTPLGESYLVPFRNNKRNCMEVQLIPGYRGLIKLARQSEAIGGVDAQVVYEKDNFEIEFGLQQKLVHRPYLDGDRGGPRLFYAIVRAKDPAAEPIVELMTLDQIDAIRRRSKAGQSGPWVTDYEEMGRKTVIKRALKRAPMSTELWTAISLDNQAENGEPQTIDVDPEILGADETPEEPELTATEVAGKQLEQKVNGKGDPEAKQRVRETKMQQLLSLKRDDLNQMAITAIGEVFGDDMPACDNFLESCSKTKDESGVEILADAEITSAKNNKGNIVRLLLKLEDLKTDPGNGQEEVDPELNLDSRPEPAGANA